MSADALSRGRAAADAGEWADARDLLCDAELTDPADVNRLAWACFFTGAIDDCTAHWQRAFADWARAGNQRSAGLAAVHLAVLHFSRGAATVGGGWLSQAAQRLDPDPNCREYAWLEWLRTVASAEGGGGAEQGLERAEALREIAGRAGELDVETLAVLLSAQLLVALGRVEEATPRFDQVMALSTAGLLGPLATGFTSCGTISSCTSAGDYQRAWDWITEVERTSLGPPRRADLPGDCRMHRAELYRVRGEWSAAEIALAELAEEGVGFHTGHAAAAYTELGLLSLRRGDLEAAATAFDRAREKGGTAQPGLAELALARGEIESAASGIRAALAAASTDLCEQARMVTTAVDCAVALGDVEWAAELAARQQELAKAFPAVAQSARAAQAAGAAALALGKPEAVESLARARALWESCPAPYEAAQVRVLLAAALQAQGNVPGHSRELGAAFDAFSRLGAIRDAQRVAALLGRPLRTERVDRALMFTDVEGSTNLLTQLGDEAWIDLLRGHDAALRQCFARHQGLEVHQKGGGDGFFVAFPSPRAGLDCSLDIQQAMREWGGHPLAVRIGVHWATVTRAEGDFSGRGVHEAARIAALARGGEILASTATVAAAGERYRTGEVREVTLRGLPGTAWVAAVLPAA